MRNLFILLPATLLLLMTSCKKDSSPSPGSTSTTTTTTTTSPYYFKFTLGSTTYNYTADIPQYMPFDANAIGGYEVANASLWPGIGIRLMWPLNDTVKESDVMGLKGKTLYFTDTTIHPELSFSRTSTSDVWYSNDTSNTSFNVKITDVTYLKNDTTLGYAVRTYVLTGTCSGVMSVDDSTSVLSGGSFSFIISRRDL